MRLSSIVLMFTLVSAVARAETHSVRIQPPEGKSGYEGTLEFASGMKNCYGEVHAAFGSPKFQPTRYHYEGKVYSPEDFGKSSFSAKSGSATLEADVYDGEFRLGRTTFTSVTFFSAAGCFTETYKVIRQLSLNDQDFLKKIPRLSLRNFSVTMQVEDYKLNSELNRKAQEERNQVVAAEREKQEEIRRQQEELRKSQVGSGRAVPTQMPNAATPMVSKSQSSPSDNRSDIANAQRRAIEAGIAEDQRRVDAMAKAATDIGEAASKVDAGIGMAFLMSDEMPAGAEFNNSMIGVTFGNSKNPNDLKDSNRITSGLEFMLAVGLDYLGNEPRESVTVVTTEDIRRYNMLLEMKAFGNLKFSNELQPYVGIGVATYTDFSTKMVEVDSGWDPAFSIGFAAVWTDGWFRMGYNFTTQCLDFGFAL